MHPARSGLISAQGIEAFWLMKLHTGNFGLINLQPFYSAILGVLTLVVAGSGLGMLIGEVQRRNRASNL